MQPAHNQPSAELAQPTFAQLPHDLSNLTATAAAAWVRALSYNGGLSQEMREAIRATAILVLAAMEPVPAASLDALAPVPSPSPEPNSPTTVASDLAVFSAEAASVPAASEPAVSAEVVQALVSKFSGPVVSPRLDRPAPIPPPTSGAAWTPPLLSLLARRADLCARACEWAIRRYDSQINLEDFDLIKPEYNAIRDEAGTMQPLFLWMINRETSRIPRDNWVMLAGCYRNMARAAVLISSLAEGRDADSDLVGLLAESQSMVLSALSMAEAPHDTVQQNIFDWCRAEAARRGEYIAHLSSAEPTNPALWGGLSARIDAATERCEAARRKSRNLRMHLNTVRYHIDQIQEDVDGDHGKDWTRIDEAIRKFLDAGGQPSDPKLIDLIFPVADLLPDEYAMREATYRRVLPFVDHRFAAELRPPKDSADDRTPSPELLEVRELLRGKVVVLIGGEARRQQGEALERELELKELRWLSSREHESISSFIPDIRRPETALVLLAIRWASHSFEDVQATCIEFDKPFVRLPGGYGANRVAYEVIRQQGNRLRKQGG